LDSRRAPLTRRAPDDASHRSARVDLSPQAGRGELNTCVTASANFITAL